LAALTCAVAVQNAEPANPASPLMRRQGAAAMIASAAESRSPAKTAGCGPTTGYAMSSRLTQTVRSPAEAAPATSHQCPATNHAPSAGAYAAGCGFNGEADSTTSTSRPAPATTARAASRADCVNTPSLNPTPRSSARASAASGYAGI